MNMNFRTIVLCLLTCFAMSITSPLCLAQGKRGFNWSIQPNATNLELNDDQGHWAMEVTFKPMRLVRLNITDPATGKKKEQLVWYLVYKAVNRPLVKQENTKDTKPINTEDTPHSDPYFVPEFVLVRNDNDGTDAYTDQVLPQAQKMILKRELRGNDAKHHFKNSVEIIDTIPNAVAKGKEKAGDTIYGIATWTGVDSRTDNFTVYMSGFSSGYKTLKGPQGKDVFARRTIVQKFWRPGDEFDQDEIEFRRKGNANWVYRPDPQLTK